MAAAGGNQPGKRYFPLLLEKENAIEDYKCGSFESREETGLFEAVMRLPEKYREVIHLYYYEDLSIKETARILRITEGSVKMRLSRGRSFLRDVFKEEES